MFCVARDVFEQEEMLKSERRFKALVQEGYDLIGILDAEGNYTYVSPTSTILGITQKNL
jgi:PAS domain-containing protein